MKHVYHLISSACMGITIGLLISLGVSSSIGSTFVPMDPAFSAQFANQNVAFGVSLLIYAALGVVSYLCSRLYENEKIKLLPASLIHVVLTVVTLLAAGLYLKWFPITFSAILVFCLVAILVWLVIWVSFYFHYKARIQKFNASRQERH